MVRAHVTIRTVRVLDVAVALWLMTCVVLGLAVWDDIRNRLELSERLIRTGASIEETGASLSSLRNLPFAGESFARLQADVEDAGRVLVTSGNDLRRMMTRIAVVAGAGTGVLLAAIVLLAYLPFRIGWRRDVRAVAGAIEAGAPGLDRYLAHRALVTLSWQRVWSLSDDDSFPSFSVAETRRLADAELARLGLTGRR